MLVRGLLYLFALDPLHLFTLLTTYSNWGLKQGALKLKGATGLSVNFSILQKARLFWKAIYMKLILKNDVAFC